MYLRRNSLPPPTSEVLHCLELWVQNHEKRPRLSGMPCTGLSLVSSHSCWVESMFVSVEGTRGVVAVDRAHKGEVRGRGLNLSFEVNLAVHAWPTRLNPNPPPFYVNCWWLKNKNKRQSNKSVTSKYYWSKARLSRFGKRYKNVLTTSKQKMIWGFEAWRSTPRRRLVPLWRYLLQALRRVEQTVTKDRIHRIRTIHSGHESSGRTFCQTGFHDGFAEVCLTTENVKSINLVSDFGFSML